MASEDRRHVRARVLRLVEAVDVQTLLRAEDVLKEGVQKIVSRNPSGSKAALPCERCKGKRPPAEDCEPWHLRAGPLGLVPRGALCQPCEWAKDSGKDRLLWKHWAVWRSLRERAGEGTPLLLKVPPPKRARVD